MKETKRFIDATTAAINTVLSATKEKRVGTIARNLRSGFIRPRPLVTDAATAPTAIMVVRIRKRRGRTGSPYEQNQPFVEIASRIVTDGDRPGTR
jgi:hypothetical protein